MTLEHQEAVARLLAALQTVARDIAVRVKRADFGDRTQERAALAQALAKELRDVLTRADADALAAEAIERARTGDSE